MRISPLAPALALGWLAVTASAMAAPMGFRDSTMLMGDLSGNWQELQSNFAFTARDALGASAVRLRPDSGSPTEQLLQLEYTRRLARWNQPDAQANVWLLGGVGRWRSEGPAASGADRAQLLASPGAQVDYETTRLYASAAARLYRTGSIRRDVVSARLGASLYETAYEETQPWGVVEVRRMQGVSERIEVTPMLRLVNRRFFAEVGISQAAHLRANFMLTF